MQLPHLASRLYGTPLLLARAKLDIILSVLGERIDWPASSAVLPVATRSNNTPPRGDIAVIAVHGTLVRRGLGLEAASGLTSYAELSAMLNSAVADPGIQGIVLDVDSPGGEAGGVFELAQQVRAATAVKPIWAVASDAAYSAAYAIASAASRLYVTQTGGVGSIGVIAMHVDQSVRDAQAGYRYTAITAGEHKNDASPHQPLSQTAAQCLQAEVSRLYEIFVTQVAQMRSLDPELVRATQAGLYFGEQAIEAGLADVQGSLEMALRDFSSRLSIHRTRQKVITTTARHWAALPEAKTPRKDMHMTEQDPDIDNDSVVTNPEPEPAAPPVAPSAPTPPAPPAPPDPAEQIAAATQAARTEATAIAELCQLAGQSGRITAFLAQGATQAEVRQALLATRASGPEITSMLNPDAPAQAMSTEHNPLIKAVQKLHNKD
jgi:capsid assembly protease